MLNWENVSRQQQRMQETLNLVFCEKSMRAFVHKMDRKLSTSKKLDRTYKNMLKQIRKYWKKLFSRPIVVQAEHGPLPIQPQRTNNTLERFFCFYKKIHRKRNGSISLTKTIRYMLADTPLVLNLKNEAYLRTILNGTDSLEARFAQIEMKRVRVAATSRDSGAITVRMTLKTFVRSPSFMHAVTQRTEAFCP